MRLIDKIVISPRTTNKNKQKLRMKRVQVKTNS